MSFVGQSILPTLPIYTQRFCKVGDAPACCSCLYKGPTIMGQAWQHPLHVRMRLQMAIITCGADVLHHQAAACTDARGATCMQDVLDNLMVSAIEYRGECDPDVLPYRHDRYAPAHPGTLSMRS